MKTRTDQFEKCVMSAESVTAYEMWVAVWSNRGRGHVMLGAPTLEALADRWEQITSCDFDRTIAQHVAALKYQPAPAGGAPVARTADRSRETAMDSEAEAEVKFPCS